MGSFYDLQIARGLNPDSRFEDIAEAAIETYYLQPYPGKEDKRPRGINRKLHGGVHVARSALNAELLVNLYFKFAEQAGTSATWKPQKKQKIKLNNIESVNRNNTL